MVIIQGDGGCSTSKFFNMTWHFVTISFIFIKLYAQSAPGVMGGGILATEHPNLGCLHSLQLSPQEVRVDSNAT